MFARIKKTWSLMGASWDVLKKDKELLVFPLLSGFSCLLVLASFAIPIVATGAWKMSENAGEMEQVAYYSVMFLFYLVNYFVITFFNTAIISSAMLRMEGGDPTVSYGFREALSRIHLIFGWALLAATVGLVLRIIEDRSEKIGRFVVGLLGMAWTLVTFMVVPVLVVERKGPIAALKESSSLLKQTWGEQLVGSFSFGAVFFLLQLPAIALIAVGFFAQNGTVLLACIGAAIMYWIVLALVQSALQSVFQAALYLHAKPNKPEPEGYPVELLASSFQIR